MENIIEIEGLEKSYGDSKAVDGITFNVKPAVFLPFWALTAQANHDDKHTLQYSSKRQGQSYGTWKGHRPPRGGHKENYGNSLSVDHAGR